MSFIGEFVDDRRGIVYTGNGALCVEDIVAVKQELFVTPERVRRIRYAYVRLHEVTSFPSTSDDMRELVRIDLEIARLTPELVVAIIAPADLPYGMARMWETMAEGIGWTTNVFRGQPEAEQWVHETLAVRVSALGKSAG